MPNWLVRVAGIEPTPMNWTEFPSELWVGTGRPSTQEHTRVSWPATRPDRRKGFA